MHSLLQSMTISVFQNPLLRTISINGKNCIAHVLPYINGKKILWKFLDNPLENEASIGSLRALISNDRKRIMIEKNDDPRNKNSVECAVESRCNILEREIAHGSELVRGSSYFGEIGEEYSNLLSMLIPSYGNAFQWTEHDAISMAALASFAIIQRNDFYYDTPTFDLVLLT